MTPLQIKLVAYRDADESVFAEGREKVQNLLNPENLEFVDHDPDVLYFVSGGSEASAVAAVEKGGFYVLVAGSEGNANASAMEVKAAMHRMSIESVLLDGENPATADYLHRLHQVKNGIHALNGLRLGLIGELSEWLVASDIKPETLESRLGIRLLKTAWEALPEYNTMTAPHGFLSTFSKGNPQDVEKAGQVYALLKACIDTHRYDALTVECFSLVKSKGVSGCLALAMLNSEGIPAACEGDIVSVTGMILAESLTGQIPWMANVARIGYEKTLLAHCTIAPDLVKDFSIKTHFETGVGTAIQGHFTENDITVFRLDENLERIFVTTGTILARPTHSSACRTQIEVHFPSEAVDSLRENPLGNHHLILPGDQTETLLLASKLLKLEQVI